MVNGGVVHEQDHSSVAELRRGSKVLKEAADEMFEHGGVHSTVDELAGEDVGGGDGGEQTDGELRPLGRIPPLRELSGELATGTESLQVLVPDPGEASHWWELGDRGGSPH